MQKLLCSGHLFIKFPSVFLSLFLPFLPPPIPPLSSPSSTSPLPVLQRLSLVISCLSVNSQHTSLACRKAIFLNSLMTALKHIRWQNEVITCFNQRYISNCPHVLPVALTHLLACVIWQYWMRYSILVILPNYTKLVAYVILK